MPRRNKAVAFLLAALAAVAFAAVPPDRLGLSFREEGGAWVFSRPGVRLVYVPGVGWAPPLAPDLPPPEGRRHALGYAVARAAGLVAENVPPARLRYARYPERTRLVLDLPAPPREGEPVARRAPPYALLVPYFVEDPPELPGVRFVYERSGTRIVYTPPEGRLGFLYAFSLPQPPRFVVDLFAREPEWEEPLAPGIAMRLRYAYVPYPLKLVTVEAAPGRYRLVPVGRPGERHRLGALAPDALAILNGGYFDPRTGTPVGLWVVDGVSLSYPAGRSALLWDGGRVFAARPRYRAFAWLSGRRLPVGVNATPARYTAYTATGEVGRPGEVLLVVEGDRVAARRPAPYRLPPGAWALAYRPPDALLDRVPLGAPVKLRVRLTPPVRYALEAGPLLVDRGRVAYAPEKEGFDPKARLLTKVTYQSAVAWTKDGGLWFVVSEKTTPGVLARALAGLGAWGAIRMDSGGSAQLWAEGRLVYPSRARKVVNGLALYPSPALGQ